MFTYIYRGLIECTAQASIKVVHYVLTAMVRYTLGKVEYHTHLNPHGCCCVCQFHILN